MLALCSKFCLYGWECVDSDKAVAFDPRKAPVRTSHATVSTVGSSRSSYSHWLEAESISSEDDELISIHDQLVGKLGGRANPLFAQWKKDSAGLSLLANVPIIPATGTPIFLANWTPDDLDHSVPPQAEPVHSMTPSSWIWWLGFYFYQDLPPQEVPSVSGDGDPPGPRLRQVPIRHGTNGMLPRERAWCLAHLLSGQDCHANDRSAPADSPQPDDSLRPRNRPPGLSCPGSFSEVPCLSTGRGTRALPPEKKWNHWGEPWIVDSESPSCDRMRSFSRTVMEKPSSAEGQALYSACKWEHNIRRGAVAMEPMV